LKEKQKSQQVAKSLNSKYFSDKKYGRKKRF